MSRCILILVQSSILSWKVMETCDKPKKLVWSVSSVSENRIHLLHQTTREFLVQKGFADANNQTQPITEVESHSVLAISCIASIHSISGMLSSNIDPYALTYSEETSSNESQRFLIYPSQNWFRHVHDACPEKEQSLVLEIEHICNPNTDVFPSWAHLYNMRRRMTFAENSYKKCQHALDSRIYWNECSRRETA